MHDIDHAPRETDGGGEQGEGQAYAAGQLESSSSACEEFAADEAGSPYPAEVESPFSASGEMELATELLEITDATDLEEFLGRFIQRVARAAGGGIPASARRAIGDILKGAAGQVLPVIASAGGRAWGGTGGAWAGSRPATAAGRLFGLELEGLSGEDQEYEVARGFIRFAGGAVRNMAGLAGSRNPRRAARDAAVAAARIHAPGLALVRGSDSREEPCPPSSSRGGRWMRRGNRIILYGV